MKLASATAAFLPLLAGLAVACAQDNNKQAAPPDSGIATRGVVVVADGPPGDGNEMVLNLGGFDDGNGLMMFGGDGLGDMVGNIMDGALPGMMGGGALSFPLTAQEVEQYGRLLRFTSDQIDATKMVLDGYVTAFKAKADEAKAKMNAIKEEAKENEDKTAFKKLAPIMKDMRDERDKSETAFLGEMKSVATPDQAARWEKVEMFRRRGKSLRAGGMAFMPGGGPAGERIDIVKVLSGMNIPQAAGGKLEAILDAWELDIDAKLKERAALQIKQRDAMKEAAKNQNQDFSFFMKFQQEQYEQSVKIRDANRATARQVKEALPADLATQFDQEFRKLSFPQVYRPRYAGKAIAAAEKFDDLTDAQKKDLAAVKTAYAGDSDVLNHRAEDATDKAEIEQHKKQAAEAKAGENGGMSFTISSMMGDNEDPAMDAIRKDRKDLEDKTVTALQALLSEDQKTRLPTRPGADPDGQQPKMRMIQKNNFQTK